MDQPLTWPSSPNPWYAVQTLARKELAVATVLREWAGLTIYLPQIRQRTRDSLREVPFFPGYLFVCADLPWVRLSSINTTPGVLRLVAFSGPPSPIPPTVIVAIREEVDRLNLVGGWPLHPFHPGDLVRVNNGPLAGLEAIFLGPCTTQERVRVLLDFLGGLHEAQLDVTLLEHAAAAPRGHKRGTRGHQRRSVC